jgi:C_GCAxxG_C_C family probable redox protein
MESGKELAIQLHDSGNSCAESVVKACNTCMKLNLSDDAIRMSSGLGGGLGGSGCVCGALNGACLILGVIAGRREVDEKAKPEIYKNIREFQQRFVKRFGSTCCHVLKGPELRVSCGDLTGNTVAMLEEFLQEKGLKK